MTKFGSWGNLVKTEHQIEFLQDAYNLPEIFNDFKEENKGSVLAVGNGRSYGDVCTNSGKKLLKTEFLDHIISFEPEKQTIECESGVMLKDLQRFLVPNGFMLPVTPGTQLITVGGAIANDVHCKNHHMFGTFGHHVESFTLARSDGEILKCSATENKELYKATIGGIGLTGVILTARLKLKPVCGPWINAENVPYENLDEFYQLAISSEANYEHTVSWIDCITGNGERGIFMRGNNASDPEYCTVDRNIKVPFMMPFSLVNRFSLFAFNKMYYWAQTMKSSKYKAHYEKFFYPLDNILEWNRIYGPKGFFQYQCVVPMDGGFEAIKEMQKVISESGQGSFLGVLKTFGKKEPAGLLSFPKEGFTYALDFPNLGAKTLKLFESLDAIVKNVHGRLYLAKDARQPKELFETGYGTELINEFVKFRDPAMSSDLSRRLLGF